MCMGTENVMQNLFVLMLVSKKRYVSELLFDIYCCP